MFDRFQEIGGKLDYNGGPDPLTSPLAVAGYALDTTREFIELESGGPDVKTRLGRAGAVISDVAVSITPEAAHDPAVYRDAREFAAEQGKVMTIAGDEGAGSITPPGGGNGAS